MKAQTLNNNFHRAIVLLSLVICCQWASAQIFKSTSPEKDQTRNGNKEFKKENYADAEADYKKALDKKNNMPEAVFNLGDAVYKQKRYGEAQQQFDLSARTNADPMVKAKALHNLGNSYMEEKKYEDAIRSYKQSLRWNPNDKDTKYNLAYANEMLRVKNQQQQQNDKNKDKKDKDKDKKEDKKEEKKDQRPDSNQDQQAENKEGDKKDQQQKGPKPRLTKQDAEKLLQALNNEEQKTNQKMQQKQVKANGVKILKDW